jgi:hypothetical protein
MRADDHKGLWCFASSLCPFCAFLGRESDVSG